MDRHQQFRLQRRRKELRDRPTTAGQQCQATSQCAKKCTNQGPWMHPPTCLALDPHAHAMSQAFHNLSTGLAGVARRRGALRLPRAGLRLHEFCSPLNGLGCISFMGSARVASVQQRGKQNWADGDAYLPIAKAVRTSPRRVRQDPQVCRMESNGRLRKDLLTTFPCWLIPRFGTNGVLSLGRSRTTRIRSATAYTRNEAHANPTSPYGRGIECGQRLS
jgi:hypothetical protein